MHHPWLAAPIQEALSSGVAGRVRSARTVVDRTLLALLHAVFRMVERGLLHNDLKPANLALILVDGRVEVKVRRSTAPPSPTHPPISRWPAFCSS